MVPVKPKATKAQNLNLNMENSLREIDYKMLESLLMKDKIQSYNKVLASVNEIWAKPLGFSLT